MSDPNVPVEGTPDTTPTEALQLADQEPIAAAPAPAPAQATVQTSGRSHTRTILEVIGGVVAAGLIVMAGAVGFAVGHATSDGDGRWSMTNSGRADGPDAGGPLGQGFGQRDGQGHQGQGFGQGPGMMGQPGQPGQPGPLGQDPRGIDPDGDNWTGQNQQDDDSEQTLPTTPSQQG